MRWEPAVRPRAWDEPMCALERGARGLFSLVGGRLQITPAREAESMSRTQVAGVAIMGMIGGMWVQQVMGAIPAFLRSVDWQVAVMVVVSFLVGGLGAVYLMGGHRVLVQRLKYWVGTKLERLGSELAKPGLRVQSVGQRLQAAAVVSVGSEGLGLTELAEIRGYGKPYRSPEVESQSGTAQAVSEPEAAPAQATVSEAAPVPAGD